MNLTASLDTLLDLTAPANGAGRPLEGDEDIIVLKTAVHWVQKICKASIAHATVRERFPENDWRVCKIILDAEGEIVAILNRNHTWTIFRNDTKSIEAMHSMNPDGIFRSGYLVSEKGDIQERVFTRSGRLVLKAEEAEKIDLGPYDPNL